jgi:hypothetical protein
LNEPIPIIVGPGAECERALERAGSRPPIRVPSLAHLRDAAEDAPGDRVWLLDSHAEPVAETIAALLDAPSPMAASLPLDHAGQPVEALMGRFVEDDVEHLLRATRERHVPLRHTFVTSLLVDRAAVLAEDAPAPDRFGAFAGSEWTARLFKRTPALLVPRSTVRVAARVGTRPLDAVRAGRAAGWSTGETLRALARGA